MAKPVLLGLDNPHPTEALAPWPPNCSGWRLWKMLNERTGATPEEYEQAFDRRNIKTHSLPGEGQVVVVLGEEVRKALGLPKVLIHPVQMMGLTFRQVPHPSGRTLFYNDPVQRQLVAMLLEELYRR